MREQVGPPHRFQIRFRRTGWRVPIAREKAAGQMQRQRQIAELGGDRIQHGIVRRQVRPVLAQQRQALGAGEHAERQGVDAEVQAPALAAAGDQHPAAARLRPPARQQGLVLAVVEHQQAGQRTLPLGRDQLDLVVQRESAEVVPELQSAGAAAGGDLGRHRRGIGEAEPEDPALEILPVAMDELAGELGLADAAEAGGGSDLTDGRGLAGLERQGERLEIRFAADEERIAGKRHARARRQGRRCRHRIQRHGREARLGLGQPVVGDRRRRRVLEGVSHRCGWQLAREDLAQVVLQALLQLGGRRVGGDVALVGLQGREVSVQTRQLVPLVLPARGRGRANWGSSLRR